MGHKVRPPENFCISNFGIFDFGPNFGLLSHRYSSYLSNAKDLRSFAQKLAELEQFLFGPLDFSSLPSLSLLSPFSLPSLSLLSPSSLPSLSLLSPFSLPPLSLLSPFSPPSLSLLSPFSLPSLPLLSPFSLPSLSLL